MIPAEVTSDHIYPFLDPATDCIHCRLICRTFKTGFELFTRKHGKSMILSIGFGRYVHCWKAIRQLSQLYPTCQRIKLTHSWAMTATDRLALIALFSNAIELDFGTARGSFTPFDQEGKGNYFRSEEESDTTEARHLRDIRQGRHISYNQPHHDTMTLPIIGAQCWNLKTLIIGKCLGNITHDTIMNLTNGCPLMKNIELGAGSTSCRLGFDSLCSSLHQWKHLVSFRYGGTLHRGSFRPERQAIVPSHSKTQTLLSFHISYGTMTSSMLRHLTPFIQHLEELTLTVTENQVNTLTSMAKETGTDDDQIDYLEIAENKMETNEERGERKDNYSDTQRREGTRDESKCATPSSSPIRRNIHQNRFNVTTYSQQKSLSLKSLTLVKPQGMGTLSTDSVIKLMSVCPSLLHLEIFGVNELNHSLFQACGNESNQLQTLMMFNYSNWRSSIERGLTRILNGKYQRLQQLSMCNMNDDVIKHLMNVCGSTLSTLHCLRSPNVTDRGLDYLSQQPLQMGGGQKKQEKDHRHHQQQQQQQEHSSNHIKSIIKRKSVLQNISLDSVNVSTDAVLHMSSCLTLSTLYLGPRSPIISDATLATLINILTSTGYCTHIWLINTLTTSSGAASSLNDMIVHKNGNVRSLEELYVAELSNECCQEIADMWNHVKIIRPSYIWSRDNNKLAGPPRNGKERLQRSLSAYVSSMSE